MTETVQYRPDTDEVLDRLRACTGQALIDRLQFERHHIQRRSRYNELYLIAGLDNEGEFAERGVVAKTAVADIRSWSSVDKPRPPIFGPCCVTAGLPLSCSVGKASRSMSTA